MGITLLIVLCPVSLFSYYFHDFCCCLYICMLIEIRNNCVHLLLLYPRQLTNIKPIYSFGHWGQLLISPNYLSRPAFGIGFCVSFKYCFRHTAKAHRFVQPLLTLKVCVLCNVPCNFSSSWYIPLSGLSSPMQSPKMFPKTEIFSPKTISLSQKHIFGKTEEIKKLLLSRHFSTFEFFPKTSFLQNTMQHRNRHFSVSCKSRYRPVLKPNVIFLAKFTFIFRPIKSKFHWV